MPDQIQSAEPGTLSPEQTALKQQFDYHTAMAFGEKPPEQPQEGQTSTTSAATGEPLANTAANASDGTSQAAAQPAFDEPGYLKNNFGWENLDAAKAEVEELRKLKLQGTIPAEIKYTNEESKKWHKYIQEGKEDELYNSLHAKRQVKDIDNLNDEQKLKLFIKMQYPAYSTNELLDAKFKKTYSFDESEFKDEEGNVTDHLGLQLAKAEATQKMQDDLSRANEYFTQYKTKIELPDINQPQQSVDNDYEGYKAGIADANEKHVNVIAPAINALKETDIQLGFKVDDANTQMQFDVSIVPDKEDFETAKKLALNYGGYIGTTIFDEKGNFNAVKLQRMILLEKNFDKYVQSAARQAVNAERARVIAKESAGGGTTRDFNIIQPTNQRAKEVEMAFSV